MYTENVLFYDTLLISELETRDKSHESLSVEGHPIHFKLDTGAQANVLPAKVLQSMEPQPPLTRTDLILRAFGNSKTTPLGCAQLQCSVQGAKQRLQFYVTEKAQMPILGHKACEMLGLIKRGLELAASQVTSHLPRQTS